MSNKSGRGGFGVIERCRSQSGGRGKTNARHHSGATDDRKVAVRDSIRFILSGETNQMLRESLYDLVKKEESIPEGLIDRACEIAHERHKRRLRRVLVGWCNAISPQSAQD